MSTTLSFDTSAEYCAAALVQDGTEIAAQSLAMSRGHAEALVPLVRELCASTGTDLSGIDLVAVTVGPGSFTGVRTGIAAARGFALATGAPAVGVSSLQAVAYSARQAGSPSVLVVLDTRRADFFAQLFDSDAQPCGDPAVLDAGAIQDLIRMNAPVVVGNAVARFRSEHVGPDMDEGMFASGPGVPDPADVALLAERILYGNRVASDTLSPLYLRAPEAKIPPGGGRLKF